MTSSVQSIYHDIEDTFDSIRTLCVLRDIGKVKPITKDMMRLADPRGVLGEAFPQSFSLENYAAVSGEQTKIAIEGIKETISKAIDWIIETFKKMVAWVKAKYTAFMTKISSINRASVKMNALVEKVKAKNPSDWPKALLDGHKDDGTKYMAMHNGLARSIKDTVVSLAGCLYIDVILPIDNIPKSPAAYDSFVHDVTTDNGIEFKDAVRDVLGPDIFLGEVSKLKVDHKYIENLATNATYKDMVGIYTMTKGDPKGPYSKCIDGINNFVEVFGKIESQVAAKMKTVKAEKNDNLQNVKLELGRHAMLMTKESTRVLEILISVITSVTRGYVTWIHDAINHVNSTYAFE